MKGQLFSKLMHGGDYNPEQWLNRPDILEKDIRLMKEANINCVTLGVFSWARLEPEENVYDTEWLEKIIQNLYENGIHTVLATPGGALPQWLSRKYEEVLQVQEDGIRNLPGERHNFCPSSPIMRKKIKTSRMTCPLTRIWRNICPGSPRRTQSWTAPCTASRGRPTPHRNGPAWTG